MSRALALVALLALVAFLGLGACAAPPPPPQELAVHVESDPGRALEGAQILYGDKTVASTAADGVAKVSLNGREGESFDVGVRCPDGYLSPPSPVSLTVRRLADPTKVPRYEARCRKAMRSVIVAVRADRGANLPVLYLGREVARTDAFGAAHVLLEVHPDEQLDLMLGTGEKGGESLRPQNPVATFVMKGHDELFVFEPRFTVEAKKRVVRAPAPKGPIRLASLRR